MAVKVNGKIGLFLWNMYRCSTAHYVNINKVLTTRL
jgi:hypothetical protein